MRKKLLALSAAVLFVFVSAVSAQAVTDEFKMYMTKDSTTNVEKTDAYGWGNLPYLYIHIPNLHVLDHENTSWFATSFATTNYTDDFDIAKNDTTSAIYRDLWLTPKNWFNPDVRIAGDWKVQARVYSQGTKPILEGAGCRPFKVVPEPISSALFLLGGATLAVVQYRRKHKKA